MRQRLRNHQVLITKACAALVDDAMGVQEVVTRVKRHWRTASIDAGRYGVLSLELLHRPLDMPAQLVSVVAILNPHGAFRQAWRALIVLPEEADAIQAHQAGTETPVERPISDFIRVHDPVPAQRRLAGRTPIRLGHAKATPKEP